MRTSKIYFLNSVPLCNTLLLTIAVMLCIISPRLIYFMTGSLYLLIPFAHFTFPLTPTSGNHRTVLCICELGCYCFWISTCNSDDMVFVFLSDSFHLVQCTHCPSWLSQMSRFHSFMTE